MAIIKSYQLATGEVVENAYHRVTGIEGTETETMVFVAVFSSRQAKLDGEHPLESANVYFNTQDMEVDYDAPVATGYALLKTHPNWAPANESE